MRRRNYMCRLPDFDGFLSWLSGKRKHETVASVFPCEQSVEKVSLCFSAMPGTLKFLTCLIFSLCTCACSVFGEVAQTPPVRDPFWPVEYGTQLAGNKKTLAKANVVVPITEADWELAREAIPRPSGIFVGRHPKTDERVDKMILLGTTVYAGDQLCTTNEFIAFTWHVDAISFRQSRFELSPVSAERLKRSRK